MESSKLTGAARGEWTAMSPLTWDRPTPMPGADKLDEIIGGTEPTPVFETADLEDGFGVGEGEQAVV